MEVRLDFKDTPAVNPEDPVIMREAIKGLVKDLGDVERGNLSRMTPEEFAVYKRDEFQPMYDKLAMELCKADAKIVPEQDYEKRKAEIAAASERISGKVLGVSIEKNMVLEA